MGIHTGWLEGDTYYAIFGGKRPGIAKSPTLEGEWKYVGDLFAHGVPGVSLDEDVSCPDLFKLGDRHVLLCISHRLGCRYYIGDWRDEKFFPESHAKMSWVDNTFFAPESLVDHKGRRIMWAWILDGIRFGVRPKFGWSGTMSLPRVLSLGDDGRLRMDVPKEIETLRHGAFRMGPPHDPIRYGPDCGWRRRRQPRVANRDRGHRGIGVWRQGVRIAGRTRRDIDLP